MHIFLRDKSSNVEYTRNKIGREKFNQLIDKKFALLLVRSWGNNLQYLEDYQDDEEIVLAACEIDKSSIQYASPRLQCRLQNIIFEREHGIDEGPVCDIRIAKLKDLHQIVAFTSEIKEDLQETRGKVKQKTQNEVKMDK